MTNPKADLPVGLIIKRVAIACLFCGFAGASLFIPAGTFNYPQAWIYLLVFLLWFLSHMIVWSPSLLARRANFNPGKETNPKQKLYSAFMGLLWITLHVLPALDRRYNLKASVPTIISIAAGILAIIGMALTSQSGIYNEYMAVAVKVDSDQKVVSTGPYALVRHPMYTGYVLYFGFTPIALGSWWGIAPAFCFLLVIVWRLFDEENYLRKNLEGYPAYCAKVRWHLIPYLF